MIIEEEEEEEEEEKGCCGGLGEFICGLLSTSMLMWARGRSSRGRLRLKVNIK
jgi:hypothetical protein